MKIAETFFSQKQWIEILDLFADLVKEKKYNRIEYDDWRIISTSAYADVKIELFSDTKSSNIIITINHKSTACATDDHSLGSFLFKKCFNEEKKTMSYNNDIAADYLTSATIDTTTLGVKGEAISCSACTCDTISTNTIKTSINDSFEKINNQIQQRPTFTDVNRIIADSMKEKEKEKRNMKNFNFNFGPCTDDQVRLSMYGLAVKNQAGVYVSYNPKTKEIIDVDILNFDGAKYMYKIPVALKDIALGDIIIHNRKPMFVVALSADGTNTLTCVDVCAGEQKTVIPTTNMFGFNFITKVVSLFNTIGTNAPSPDAPFGNMLPLMLMDDGNDEKFNPMMLMMMMNQGGNQMFSNPLMMMLMLSEGESKDKDWMKMMVLAQMMNQNSNT